MMLAPRIEVCEALLRGEAVPVRQLDPKWVKRLAITPTGLLRNRESRVTLAAFHSVPTEYGP